MPLQITSATSAPAANRSEPNSRRTIGIGEEITFSVNRAAQWTVPGTPTRGSHRSLSHRFLTPGRHTVTAQAGTQRASIQINVVVPSIRVRKLREITLPSGTVGALMHLQFTLTPTGVSFSHLQFRERECNADNVWGYFHAHRTTYRQTLRHVPQVRPVWTGVDAQNNVTSPDQAGFQLNASGMNWPITAGGFRWPIPDEYQIGTRTFRFLRPMTQSIRFDPASGATRPPFRGTITVWKGSQRVRRTYS